MRKCEELVLGWSIHPCPATDCSRGRDYSKATAIIAIEADSQRPICFGRESSRPKLAFFDAATGGFDRTTAELDLVGLSLPAGSYYIHATYLQHITQILLISI